ncbi:hypothetical protein B0H13DRAFT_1919084 [Mycena leptocephala]|nr:hypothetical protein B0H13DRAFT_1919084 [Mycena leptocephala]
MKTILPLCFVLVPCMAFSSNLLNHSNLSVRSLDAGFNPSQEIDVTGAHAFVAAGRDDFRGPCPGLNALANHNYIPHNGVVSFLDAVTAAMEEGPPPGLSGTHNQFESDSSPTRCNYYQCNGDNHNAKPEYFQDIVDILATKPAPSQKMEVIFQHRVRRFDQSVQEDAYFWYGPLEMVVSCVVHFIIPRVMSNYSNEHPDGLLSPDVLKSIYGMHSDPDGNLQYIRGTEQIPSSFYRRPDPYFGITSVVSDLVALGAYDLRMLVVGGNVNGPNTFVPLNLTNFSHGVYSTSTLLEEDNLLVPGHYEPLVTGLVAQLVETLGQELLTLTCPRQATFDLSLLEKYPGYRKSMNRSRAV